MLTIKNIKKTYKTASFTQKALDDVTVSFRENEFAAILGPSGSGKTTLLNIIGGLDHYDTGDLVIDNISTKKYKDRDWDTYRNNRIGFVFQSYNLIPHQTVLSNVELALTLSGVSKSERRKRAIAALEEVGLKEHIHKKPNQLSGGQMQRVAIARALVNNPSILLADEPTGALDSKTSIQVMDMLKEVASDRLVIMVTHNPELAKEYANRIITLKDGKIVDDTNPYKEDVKISRVQKIRKASMSFMTALSLSFSNLMTKKGRTFVTSIAGSIGIIGIALILALANGVNQYIEDVQRDTLSIYPLSIQKTGVNISSFTNKTNTSSSKGKKDEVQQSAYLQRMFNSQSTNDLKSFKSYIEKNKKSIEKSVSSIEYKYDVKPEIYLKDNDTKINKVNPDPLLNSMNMSSNSMMSSMMSSVGMTSSMTAFNELPGKLSLYSNQYDVLKGKWPTKYNEAVLVLDDNGKVSDFQLYELGLKDREEFKTIIESFSKGKKSDQKTKFSDKTYTYKDLMSAKLTVVNSTEKYQYNNDAKAWVDKSEDVTYMKDKINKGIDLKIVGIVKATSKDTVTSLNSGVYYTPALVTKLMEDSANSQIVKEQIANPDTNVLTNHLFSEDNAKNKDFDFSSIITVDQDAIRSAFNFDTSKVNVNTSNLDLNGVSSIAPPNIDVNALTQALSKNINVPVADINRIVGDVMMDFIQEEITNGVTSPTQMQTDLSAYLARPAVQQKMQTELNKVISSSGMQEQINKNLQTYMQQIMTTYMKQLSTSIQNSITSYTKQMMTTLQKQLPSAISVDPSKITGAFKLNMSQEELGSLLTSMMTTETISYDNNLKKFNYATEDNPSSINIYPVSFQAKEDISAFITDYNKQKQSDKETSKVIQYTDLVGTMMTSVTDIVNMVSYVLIAFVGISLVVSSIMIGVITYISVLERKKEIGILRAMGASKQNIRQVFNAETIIIGLLSGLIGVLVAYIFSFFANIIIYNNFEISNIARLPILAAIILVCISVFLTFIAGLFPAASAAHKDPVEALRSE